MIYNKYKNKIKNPNFHKNYRLITPLSFDILLYSFYMSFEEPLILFLIF